jgi:hypothetical protein
LDGKHSEVIEIEFSPFVVVRTFQLSDYRGKASKTTALSPKNDRFDQFAESMTEALPIVVNESGRFVVDTATLGKILGVHVRTLQVRAKEGKLPKLADNAWDLFVVVPHDRRCSSQVRHD